MRYAVVPQVLPNFASYTLWRFELNVRTAAVMGFVGAGGIGQELITAVRMLYYEDVSALVLLIVLTVACIDLLCERIRHRAGWSEAVRARLIPVQRLEWTPPLFHDLLRVFWNLRETRDDLSNE